MKQENTIPHAKITDQAFSRWVLTSVIGIVICIICLCSTTYAWFTDSLPSTGNEIKMAEECGLQVIVYQGGSALGDVRNGVELVAGVEYSVKLSLPGNTSSGYCLIEADGVTYRSPYIERHADDEPHIATFTLKVERTQEVTFTPRWGIYLEGGSVADGGELTIS